MFKWHTPLEVFSGETQDVIAEPMYVQCDLEGNDSIWNVQCRWSIGSNHLSEKICCNPTDLHQLKVGQGGALMDHLPAALKLSYLCVEEVKTAAKHKLPEKARAFFVCRWGHDCCKASSTQKRLGLWWHYVLQANSHSHLHNLWICASNKHLSKHLNEMLGCDFDTYDFNYQVSTLFNAVLHSSEK